MHSAVQGTGHLRAIAIPALSSHLPLREGDGEKRKGKLFKKKMQFFYHVLLILLVDLMGSRHHRQDVAPGLGRTSTRGHRLHDSPTSNELVFGRGESQTSDL